MIVSNIRSATKFKQTVLIVDDQTVALNIHKAIFESFKLNLNIVTKTDPIEALSWAKNKQIDLIVTDFSMGKMDGMQFVQSINRANNGKLAPIIVITVLKSKHLHKALINAGATACLTKPVNATSLASMARFLLLRSKEFYNNKQLATS